MQAHLPATTPAAWPSALEASPSLAPLAAQASSRWPSLLTASLDDGPGLRRACTVAATAYVLALAKRRLRTGGRREWPHSPEGRKAAAARGRRASTACLAVPEVEADAADGASRNAKKFMEQQTSGESDDHWAPAGWGDEEDPNLLEGGTLAENPFGKAPSDVDVLLARQEELVNPDIPQVYLSVSRKKLDGKIKGVPGVRQKGRCKVSKKKLEYRLRQGAPLAHNNWSNPSRIRITSGVAKKRRLEQPQHAEVRPLTSRVREAVFSILTGMRVFDDRSTRVLDLFAGTGSIGIEGLSRGASECVFVDINKECVDACIANAWMCGFMDRESAVKGPINERLREETAPMTMVGGRRAQTQIQLHRTVASKAPVGAVLGDVFDVLKNPEDFGLADRTFNIVTVHAPYTEVSYRQLCTALAKSELIERDALVVIEYPRELGVLPPVICAPFEDPEDFDEETIAAGVPTLFGVRNRTYSNSAIGVYIKFPTGVRDRFCRPRPYEFTETLVARKDRTWSREVWRTPSIFKDDVFGGAGFARPKKAARITEHHEDTE